MLASALATAGLGLWVFAVARQALGGLDSARAPARPRDAVRFERKRLEPPGREGVRLLQSMRSARAVERFGDSYFVATDGGLLELSPQGRVVRRLDVLDGLGDSDLTSLAAYGGRLYVGTRSKGLLAFDGERFEQYLWPDRDPKSITALAADQGRLLVGTYAGGLLEFDGKGFREVRAGEGGARIDAVTFAARFGPRLYVGTFSGGLWVTEGGRWAHFTSSDGLASDRLVGVAEIGGETLAASDFGLSAAAWDGLVLSAGAREGRAWRPVLTVPSLSGVAESSGGLVICKDDGEFTALALPNGGAASLKAQEIDWTKPQAGRSGARLATADAGLWLLDSGGVRRYAESSAADGAPERRGRITFTDFGESDSTQSPTSNIVSALAFDTSGRLWIGSFRNGVDVFAPDGARRAHLESDDLREINALTPDAAGGVLVATSQGVFRLDSSLRPARLDVQGAQYGGAVTHVALLDRPDAPGTSSPAEKHQTDQLAAATPKGLALGAPGAMHVLTTVQGLPSNSVYAVWPAAGRVYAGTLGGLAEISSGRVTRVFKDSNSALSVNWVTAVTGAGGRVFVGTYGGGVFELLPSGDLRAFAETGRAFVNQNAMWADGERLYVGTLDGAFVFDLRAQRWARLRDELPSATVLSVAARGDQIYFGTTAGIARFDRSFFDKSFLDAAE